MKTKQSITPGPWFADSEHENLVGSESGVLVADCYADSPLDYGLPEVGEYMANAQAIAALPDLIAALKDVDDAWAGNGDMAEAVDHALLALAKAGIR